VCNLCTDLGECLGEDRDDCCNNVDNGTCVQGCQAPRDYITVEFECGKYLKGKLLEYGLVL